MAVRKTSRKSGTKKTPVSKAGARKAPPRTDYGLPVDGFFAKQPAHLQPILETLRKLVDETAPEAQSSIKWGMPFYTIGGTMMCALGAHKSHVNLILVGPPDGFADPEGRLSGQGKGSRHLKLESIDDLSRSAVRGWLRTAADLARQKQESVARG